MHFSLHVGGQRIAGTQNISVEEVALKLIVKRFFVPDYDGGAWLVFKHTTGQGVGLIIGPCKPHPKAERLHSPRCLGVRLGAVSLPLAPIIRAYGPEALRWDGTRVVARGN